MLRVVIRVTMSADLVSRLVSDILEVTESLMGTYFPHSLPPAPQHSGVIHPTLFYFRSNFMLTRLLSRRG
jgi:hypothetical protein